MYSGSEREGLTVSADLYDGRYYEKFNKGFEDFRSGFKFHPIFSKAVQLAEPLKDKTVLDIGCGRGELLYLCALSGSQAFGIDYSKSAVGIAKDFLDQHFSQELRSRVHIDLMDAKELRYEGRTFDIVFMLDIVEHLYDHELEKMFFEASRVLKPGGRLIVHTGPNKLMMKPVRFLFSSIGISFKSDPFHVNEQSFFSLRRHLRRRYVIRRLWIEKDRHYWFNGTPERGRVIRMTAKCVDWFLDNPISDFAINRSFLKFFFGTEFWVVAQLP